MTCKIETIKTLSPKKEFIDDPLSDDPLSAAAPAMSTSKFSMSYGTLAVLIAIVTAVPHNLRKLHLEDAEIDMGAADIIRRWDYPVEEYEVTTDDGYILNIFRIPAGRNRTIKPSGPRPVVLLQHGLEADCIMWLSNMPNQDASYLFADAGYDVWLGNFRGNQYGKRHVNMTAKDKAFWEFSWDQMAQYDLPATINFILNVTNAPYLYYAGHSMGTLTAFARFSVDQALAKKVKKFYALAPVITVKYIEGALKVVASFTSAIDWAMYLTGSMEFLPPNWLMTKLMTYSCSLSYVDRLVCSNLVFTMAGPDTKQMNYTRLPVYMAHTPAGTGGRVVVHFGQMVSSGNFQMYDYGSRDKNQKHYRQDTPPLYDLSRMETPVELYWGGKDWLATDKDLAEQLPHIKNVVGKHYLPEFNHMDFLWGLKARDMIFIPMLNDIRSDFQAYQNA